MVFRFGLRILAVGTCLSGLGALAGCAPPAPRTPATPASTLPASVRVNASGRVTQVPLEEYVLASVLAEVTPLDEAPATVARMYEVQAVLARTYAAFNLGRHGASGFDLCDTTHCQLYDPARIRTSRFADAARDAVRRTAGLILTYSGRPLEALFHSDCGGHTASAEAVWGGQPVPYLLSELDSVPKLTHRTWHVSVTADKLRAALNADPRSRVGRRLDKIDVTARDVSGRAAKVTVVADQPIVLRGEDLRAILNASLGDHAILSTRFSVTRTAGTYVFQGSGFGHGVGLCQAGALARARQGQGLSAILGAYFQGASLARSSGAGH